MHSRHGTSVARSMRRYLSLPNARVAEILVDGEIHYELSAELSRYPAIEGAREYCVTGVLTPDALVRSLTVSYVTQHNGDSVRVVYSHEYELRKVTVGRPDWVEEQRGSDDGSASDEVPTS